MIRACTSVESTGWKEATAGEGKGNDWLLHPVLFRRGAEDDVAHTLDRQGRQTHG